MPLEHRLFYAMCIRHNAFRYTAFGREANRTLGTIELPDGIPAWVDSAEIPIHDGLALSATPFIALTSPTGADWAPFRLGSLFNISRGKYLPGFSQRSGSTSVITASAKNNGVSKKLDVPPLFHGGQITVARNGSVCEAFYQPDAFFASDDVFILDPVADVPPFAMLFMTQIIRLERHRYSYGRKLRIPLLEATQSRLPTTEAGTPDYAYMEAFMAGLPFSAAVPAHAYKRRTPAREL